MAVRQNVCSNTRFYRWKDRNLRLAWLVIYVLPAIWLALKSGVSALNRDCLSLLWPRNASGWGGRWARHYRQNRGSESVGDGFGVDFPRPFARCAALLIVSA